MFPTLYLNTDSKRWLPEFFDVEKKNFEKALKNTEQIIVKFFNAFLTLNFF